MSWLKKFQQALGDYEHAGSDEEVIRLQPNNALINGKFVEEPDAVEAYRGLAYNVENEGETDTYGIVLRRADGAYARFYPLVSQNASNTTVRHPLSFIIDGGGQPITTGMKGGLYVPYSGTIEAVYAIADTDGSIVVDIWKDSFANYPPVDADSITHLTPISISSGIKYADTTLAGWTTEVTEGDSLRFNVDFVATITQLSITMVIARTL